MKGTNVNIGISSVSFGSKFSDQKAARLMENNAPKVIDDTHQLAVNLLNRQRPVAERTKKLIKLPIFEKLLKEIADNSNFKYMEKIFRK